MFSTTKKVKLIEKKKFTIAILDLNYEVFRIYIATFNISSDIDNKIHLL